MFSFLSGQINEANANGLSVKVHKHEDIEQSDMVLIQGDLDTSDGENFTLYPRFTAVCSSVPEKQSVISTMVGTTMFQKSRTVGESGITFGFRVYMPKMEYKNIIIDCIAFGKTGELIKQYAENKQIVLDGRVDFDVSKGKNGKEYKKLKMVVSGFSFVKSGEAPQQETKTKKTSKSHTTEIPF